MPWWASRSPSWCRADARSRVAGLWDLADGGASFEEVLDGLLADGLSNLAGFALVGHGDRTRVLVRGDVTATFQHASTARSPSPTSPTSLWADRTLDGVTGGRITRGSRRRSSPTSRWSPASLAPARSSSATDALGAEPGDARSSRPTSRSVRRRSSPTEPGGAGGEPEPAPEAESPCRGGARTARSEPSTRATARRSGRDRADARARARPGSPAGPAHREPLSFGAPHGDDPTPTGEQPAVADASPYPGGRPRRPDHRRARRSEDFVRPRVGIPGQELAPAGGGPPGRQAGRLDRRGRSTSTA